MGKQSSIAEEEHLDIKFLSKLKEKTSVFISNSIYGKRLIRQ